MCFEIHHCYQGLNSLCTIKACKISIISFVEIKTSDMETLVL